MIAPFMLLVPAFVLFLAVSSRRFPGTFSIANLAVATAFGIVGAIEGARPVVAVLGIAALVMVVLDIVRRNHIDKTRWRLV